MHDLVSVMKHLASYSSIICILLLLGSCSGTQQKSVFKETFEYDTLAISIDFPYLSYYHTTALYANENGLYWGGYNHLMHSVDIFSLTDQCVVESIELEPEGPDAILKNRVGSFMFNDSLLIFRGYENEIKMIDRKYRTLYRKVVPFTPEENYRLVCKGLLPGQFEGGNAMRLYNNTIVTPVYPDGDPTMEDVLVTSVNLNNGYVEHLPVSYPKDMEEDLSKYGSLTYPYLTVSADRLVYNFPYTSHVYVYNVKSGKTETFSLESGKTGNRSGQKPQTDSRDYLKGFEYESMALRFCETYYDEESGALVRVHHKEKVTPVDKEVSFLMVHKSETGETLEYPLPSGFTTRYYVHGGNVYFQLNSGSDDKVCFAVAKIRALCE